MGFENRDYYRESDYTGAAAGWGSEYITPIVKYLIIANVVVFLLQIFFTRAMTRADYDAQQELIPKAYRDRVSKTPLDEEAKAAQEEAIAYQLETERISVVQEWLELDTRKVLRGQVWRLVTYAFCHDRLGLFHILFNMLFLFWFGVTLESMYGPREFLLFYFAAALVSGLAAVALNVWTGSYNPTVGASGAVMGVLMLYAIHYPRNTIRVFWFFPLEVRWIVLLYVLFDLHPLLLALAGNQLYTGIAHAAHLGGLAFGFLYWKFNWNLERLLDRLPRLRGTSFPRPARRTVTPRSPKAERSLDEQVDGLLEKIAAQGIESLSDDERRLLESASQRYKRRRG